MICITADDYGSSASANTAIESLVRARAVSAVSIMAHAGADLRSLDSLTDSSVSIGLHITWTGAGTQHADYRELLGALAIGRTRLANLAAEARAQAERLLSRGVRLAFLNAHEHVHLFPMLWPTFARLASELGVRAVRIALGQPVDASLQGALAACSRVDWTLQSGPWRVMSPLGVGRAGSIDERSLGALLDRPFLLGVHRLRELCVHPDLGQADRRREHDLLASGAFVRVLEARGLHLATLE
ncbi:MAG: ChbG/HpnK family deacetylase [Polyangiaceae bacterium]